MSVGKKLNGDEMKKKLKSLKKLKLEADRVFSQYIRSRDNHHCYTCFAFMTPKFSQCGHYISRNYLALRFDERNAHCQCPQCNIFKKGNMAVYAIMLEKEFGVGILQELENIKLNNIGDTRIFLNGIIKKYAI